MQSRVKYSKDITIVLNSVNYQDTYDGGYTTRRAVIYTLNFIKTYLLFDLYCGT